MPNYVRHGKKRVEGASIPVRRQILTGDRHRLEESSRKKHDADFAETKGGDLVP